MANLVLDIGNTLHKAAIFQDGTLISICQKRDLQLSDIQFFIENKNIVSAIVSETGAMNDELHRYLEKNFNTIFLSHKTALPIKIQYKTPEQLGNDRIAAAVAAWARFPHSNTLVIQAGTCLVYDFINSHGEYMGGAISPGLSMRFKALHSFTAKLPSVAPDYDTLSECQLTCASTKESIVSGVFNGVIGEINYEIGLYMKKYPDLNIILTGGNMHHLKKSIKNTIFANSNLVLEGLNKILETNANQ